MQALPNNRNIPAPLARQHQNLEIPRRILNLSNHFSFPDDYFTPNEEQLSQEPQDKQIELLAANPLASKLVALLTKIGNQPTSANPNHERELTAYRKQPHKAEALVTALLQAGAPLEISEAEASPDLDTIDRLLIEDIAEQHGNRPLNLQYAQILRTHSPDLVDYLRQHRGEPIPAHLTEEIPPHLVQAASALAEMGEEVNRQSMARFKISANEISNQKAEQLLATAAEEKHLHQFEPLLKAGANPAFKTQQGWNLAAIAASEGDLKTTQQMEAHGIVNHYPQLVDRFAKAQLAPAHNFEQKKDRFHALGRLLGFHHVDSSREQTPLF
ncbi:hypothetical protein [Vampirovibrio sp.]|uniref:hypothetical protein n=1 Tax=Vampirovibrio sp. TaxID=2717857 RepID=UPI003594907F